MSGRQILALSRRALYRGGVSTHRPIPAGSLSGGWPRAGLCGDRPVATHKQEMYTDQKDGDFGVSRPLSFAYVFFRECLRRVGVAIHYAVFLFHFQCGVVLKSHLVYVVGILKMYLHMRTQ